MIAKLIVASFLVLVAVMPALADYQPPDVGGPTGTSGAGTR